MIKITRSHRCSGAGSVLLLLSLISILLSLGACQSITSTGKTRVEGAAGWALLPLDNLSTTPLAGEMASTLLETRLRARGVRQMDKYPQPETNSLAELLDDGAQARQAAAWARTSGYRYAVTGTVNEWHYKTGPDKEPAVGLSLKIIDLLNDQVVWQGSGARTGWGYSNLSRVGDKVVKELVSELRVHQSRQAPSLAAAIPASTPVVFDGLDQLLKR